HRMAPFCASQSQDVAWETRTDTQLTGDGYRTFQDLRTEVDEIRRHPWLSHGGSGGVEIREHPGRGTVGGRAPSQHSAPGSAGGGGGEVWARAVPPMPPTLFLLVTLSGCASPPPPIPRDEACHEQAEAWCARAGFAASPGCNVWYVHECEPSGPDGTIDADAQ